MERKIGEIFDYKGEWYQCVESDSCGECSLFTTECGSGTKSDLADKVFGLCSKARRSDNKHVIFKKLEKVGEPYIIGNKLIQRYKIYPTTYHINVCDWYYQNLDVKSWTIDIEIKQNKTNMAENKLNLKPFDIQKAREGKPVCTRDGRKARIICFDKISGDDYYKIVACVTAFDGDFEEVLFYGIDGYIVDSQNPKDEDLMMLPEKKEGWVNVYKGIDGITFSKHPYTSKDEAIKKSGILFGRIDTIKVSWEE